MVRNRVEVAALLLAGVVAALVQLDLFPRVVAQIEAATATRAPLPSSSPLVAVDVPVIWREFRPGERETGPASTVHICAAALERGAARSALVVRFCDAQPMTPQRRFAFGYDDLVVRAQLPGGLKIAWDLLDYEATADGGKHFTQHALLDNSSPIAQVRVENSTDVIFVIGRELPLGLPSIEVTGRYQGRDIHEAVIFEPLGADLRSTEAARVASAPLWARTAY
jgi:hypothetical protein